jgi:hypothetical protein
MLPRVSLYPIPCQQNQPPSPLFPQPISSAVRQTYNLPVSLWSSVSPVVQAFFLLAGHYGSRAIFRTLRITRNINDHYSRSTAHAGTFRTGHAAYITT